MIKPYSLRNKITFSGTPDEDGELCVSAASSTIFMTRKEMRLLRDHLDAVLRAPHTASLLGKAVRINTSGHGDLIGKTGKVEHVMPSGNLQVDVGFGEYVILSPKWVEEVK